PCQDSYTLLHGSCTRHQYLKHSTPCLFDCDRTTIHVTCVVMHARSNTGSRKMSCDARALEHRFTSHVL
ncbi:MAG: hypothetical protein AAGJ35_06490, partial [Myxococcota bacterium]